MRIITLWQPWASLIAFGLKQYETRSWHTNYRGKLLIHAAKRPVDGGGIRVWLEAQKLAGVTGDPRFHTYLDLPMGCIVAIADLIDCREMIDVASRKCGLHPALQIDSSAQTPLEKAVGNWSELRYAWKLENVIALPDPIPFKGRQGLTFTPESIREQIEALL